MKVKCVICDKIDVLDDYDVLAKKLRNRPIHTYMCSNCQERIKMRTEERKATGRFKLYSKQQEENDW